MTETKVGHGMSGAALIREGFRAGLVRPTAGLAPGLAQANLIAVPRDWAWEQVPYAITHAPGYMFLTDVPDTKYAV